MQHKLPEPPDLQALLRELADRGVQAVAVGPAALALARQEPAQRWQPLRVLVPGGDQAKLADLPVPPTVRVEPIAEQVADVLAAEPVRAWAVAVDVAGQVADPFGGLQDAAEGRLRLQGDLRAWLREDPANVLQLAVWAAQSGLRPTGEAVRLAQRDATNVLSVPRATWGEKFSEVLLGEHAGTGLQFLYDVGVLPLMVPEATAMVGFHKSCPVHHKDIWDHTLQVIEKCPPSLVVRWAALMHDTGKVLTRTVQKGKVHFFRHEDMGASLMEGVAGRFHMDPALRDRVVYVIANHARANVYATNWTDSAVRRLIRDMGEHLDDVLAFSRSDFTTKRAWRIAEVRALTEELNERIPRIAAEDAKIPPLPKGFGNVVMERTGLQPGPWLGEVTRWLEGEVEAGRLEGQREAEFYLEVVQAKRPELLSVQPGTERQRRKA